MLFRSYSFINRNETSMATIPRHTLPAIVSDPPNAEETGEAIADGKIIPKIMRNMATTTGNLSATMCFLVFVSIVIYPLFLQSAKTSDLQAREFILIPQVDEDKISNLPHTNGGHQEKYSTICADYRNVISFASRFYIYMFCNTCNTISICHVYYISALEFQPKKTGLSHLRRPFVISVGLIVLNRALRTIYRTFSPPYPQILKEGF